MLAAYENWVFFFIFQWYWRDSGNFYASFLFIVVSNPCSCERTGFDKLIQNDRDVSLMSDDCGVRVWMFSEWRKHLRSPRGGHKWHRRDRWQRQSMEQRYLGRGAGTDAEAAWYHHGAPQEAGKHRGWHTQVAVEFLFSLDYLFHVRGQNSIFMKIPIFHTPRG